MESLNVTRVTLELSESEVKEVEELLVKHQYLDYSKEMEMYMSK